MKEGGRGLVGHLRAVELLLCLSRLESSQHSQLDTKKYATLFDIAKMDNRHSTNKLYRTGVHIHSSAYS